MVRDFGFTDFEFRWLVDQEMAIYTIVIAAVWQSSGFVMAMFLAGLRSVDDSLIKAAQIDGAKCLAVVLACDLADFTSCVFQCHRDSLAHCDQEF
jgi:glucose/mannose transport system permease protein